VAAILAPALKEVVSGTVSGTLAAGRDGDEVDIMLASVKADGLIINHRFIDNAGFEFPPVSMSGDIGISIPDRTVRIKGVNVSSAGASLRFDGSLSRGGFWLDITARGLSPASAAKVVGGEELEGYDVEGAIDLNVRLLGDMKGDRKLSSVRLDGKISDLNQMSDRLDYLKKPFSYEFINDEGRQIKVVVGASNPSFTPFSGIPRYFYGAVLTSEDAGFFGHKGLEFKEIESAMADNLGGRQSMRGGSTITQQLAKNLFLSRDKTVVRKLREILLALELEATLSKQRLLEIYLNGIEWGPGLFGIGAAARYYFGRPVSEITALEAVYLASVIPGPTRYHVFFSRNQIPEEWNARLHAVLERMYYFGYVTDSELAASKGQQIVFAGRPGPVTLYGEKAAVPGMLDLPNNAPERINSR
jgi:hypothetical protein